MLQFDSSRTNLQLYRLSVVTSQRGWLALRQYAETDRYSNLYSDRVVMEWGYAQAALQWQPWTLYVKRGVCESGWRCMMWCCSVTSLNRKRDLGNLGLNWSLLFFKNLRQISHGIYTLIARFTGPTWDLSGADRTQVGPMLALWTLLSGYVCMNSLVLERYEENCRNVIPETLSYRWLRRLLWNCLQMNVTRLYWWWVNIGLYNDGILPCGNQSWYRYMSLHGVTRPKNVNTHHFYHDISPVLQF